MNEQEQKPRNDTRPQVRVRINVGHTASGKYTWDATVEATAPVDYLTDDNLEMAQTRALTASDALVADLSNRYGPQSPRIDATLPDGSDPALMDDLRRSLDSVRAQQNIGDGNCPLCGKPSRGGVPHLDCTHHEQWLADRGAQAQKEQS